MAAFAQEEPSLSQAIADEGEAAASEAEAARLRVQRSLIAEQRANHPESYPDIEEDKEVEEEEADDEPLSPTRARRPVGQATPRQVREMWNNTPKASPGVHARTLEARRAKVEGNVLAMDVLELSPLQRKERQKIMNENKKFEQELLRAQVGVSSCLDFCVF